MIAHFTPPVKTDCIQKEPIHIHLVYQLLLGAPLSARKLATSPVATGEANIPCSKASPADAGEGDREAVEGAP